jgi:S-DNA-T family DNA segregation ATPase FtsK/SpoIIIE
MNDDSKLQFLVGSTDDGKTVYGDFQKTGHFISSGHVGSGHASYDEAAFVTNLIQNYSPDQLQFVMIDPKMVQLTPYEGIPYLWRPLVLTPDDAFTAVKDLLDEMERRFDLLMDAGVNTIVEYNAKTSENLPYIILLATEIADLMMVNGEFFGRAFVKFSQMARAVGIHMYLATQRPSTEVLPDVLLGSTFGRLIFAVASEVDSERLLGNDSASKINEVGWLIFADYTSNIEKSVKANYVSDDEVMKVVESIKGSK